MIIKTVEFTCNLNSFAGSELHSFRFEEGTTEIEMNEAISEAFNIWLHKVTQAQYKIMD